MTRLLLDTNIALDVLLDRQPHAEASAAVWEAVEAGSATGMLAAHAVTTIHYLICKRMGNAGAVRVIHRLLRVFEAAAVDGPVILEALQLAFADFEDAVTAAAARAAGCTWIVTRDPKGFRGSPVRSVAPEAVLPLLGQL